MKTYLLIFFLALSCSGENIDSEVPNLEEWLSANSTISAEIKLEDDYGGALPYYQGGTVSETSFDSWTEENRQQLIQYFDEAYEQIYYGSSGINLGESVFSMPLNCSYCEDELSSNPSASPYMRYEESEVVDVYIAQVAFSLAIEAGNAVSWSMSDNTTSELHHFLNSRSLIHRLSTGQFFLGRPAGTPQTDTRDKYVGRASPATPIYSYTWMRENDIIQSTQRETLLALLRWFRDNAIHFYFAASYSNMNDHWGYPAQPSVYHVTQGTVRTTESEAQNWTAGCHGTLGVIKSLFKIINIPVEVLYICGHAVGYFPTLGLYLDHGDNPYSSVVQSQPEKSIEGILIDEETFTARFGSSPNGMASGEAECSYIGYAASNF